MKGATMFSGIDAPEVSAPGIEWLWRAEIDPFANAVSRHHRPATPNLGDVSAPDFIERAAAHGRPDVLVFGSPCQSFSVAGKRLGLDDPRGNLALRALAVAEQLRPAWLVFENVPGLFSSFSGSEHAERAVREGPIGGAEDGEENRDFAAFLTRVRECGYLGCWRVFDAQFAGVPQRRRRIFFVGYLGDWRPAGEVLFEPESLQGHPPPRREAGEGVAGTLAACAGTERKHGHGWDQQDWESGYACPVAFGGNDTRGPIDVATACDAHGGPSGRLDFESETFIAFAQNQRDEVRQMDVAGALASEPGMKQQTYVAFTRKDHGADAGDTAPTLRAMGHDGSHANAGGQVAVAQTITADMYRPGGATAGNNPGVRNCIPTGMAVRRLTPAECEALQGFPRGFTAVPYRNKPAADGPRYKALGNSMAVPVIGWILRRVQAVHAETRGAGVTQAIAALYVETNGTYYGLPHVEPWDAARDARTYAGPHPVVAHPPCARRGRYWGGSPTTWPRLKKGDDEGCFAAALAAVRRWGGVLEHPEGSHAWRHFGFNIPPRDGGWVVADFDGGWTCCVEQGWYGHSARKATWLYVHGFVPPPLNWGRAPGEFLRLEDGYHSAEERAFAVKKGIVPRLSKRQRAATPEPFRDLLLALARMAMVEEAA